MINFILNILPIITKVAATMGPFLAKYAPVLVELAGKHLPQIIKTVESISSILDVIKPNESAEELGAKAMSANKKPEDFGKNSDYIDYLRKEVTIDKNTLSNDEADVGIRKAIGGSLILKGVNDVLGTEVTIPFIKTASQLELNSNVIIEIVKSYATNNVKLDDFEKYISKTLPIDSLDKHSDTLVNAYQTVNSNMSIEQAEDEVMKLNLPTINK